MVRMETLATVVFELTPKGAAAIKSTGDELPRRLRTLLLAIDGRSTLAQYIPVLRAFEPLSEKLAELEVLGYLQRRGSEAAYVVGRPATAQNSGFGSLRLRVDATASDSGSMPLREADLRALVGNNVVSPRINVVNSFELELQALARQMSGATRAGAPAPASRQPDMRTDAAPPAPSPSRPPKPELRDLLHEMERFLSQSAGAEALPVVVMLEQIKTFAQLRAELPGYLELVQRYGPEADQHIDRLAGLLDQAGR
jgi:hypothetical protein